MKTPEVKRLVKQNPKIALLIVAVVISALAHFHHRVCDSDPDSITCEVFGYIVETAEEVEDDVEALAEESKED